MKVLEVAMHSPSGGGLWRKEKLKKGLGPRVRPVMVLKTSNAITVRKEGALMQELQIVQEGEKEGQKGKEESRGIIH